MNEEWRDIKGYEGLYQVSNLGRVKSFKDNNGNCREKILNYKPKKDGYIQVKLFKNGTYRIFKVHRLVAESFIPNPDNYPIINHKDENKTNNTVSNLEWCTQKYNINYGTHNKRVSESSKGISRENIKGSNNPKARKVQCITTGKKFNCIKEAAEYYYIDRHYIINNCKDNSKYAGKHPVTGEKLKWKYID